MFCRGVGPEMNYKLITNGFLGSVGSTVGSVGSFVGSVQYIPDEIKV